MLDGQKSTPDIGVVSFLPEVKRDFPDWVGIGFVRYAGVGYEDVDGAVVLFCRGDGGFYGGFGGDVSFDSEEVWGWGEVGDRFDVVGCYFATLI